MLRLKKAVEIEWKPDIDHCVLPEGNAEYLTDEMDRAGFSSLDWDEISPRVLENLGSVGATGSAAVPLALDEAWRTGRLQPGDRVMLLAIETSKWKYGGAVLTWTAAPAPTVRPVAADLAAAVR